MDALLLAAFAGVAFILAYRTYGRWVARRVFQLREDAATPAVLYNDNNDYCPTPKSIVFGHHFTSIAGTGPIVGPAIAVMWGWLPAVAWVVFGSIFIGAVHDLGSLVVSLRNKGRSVGDIAGDLLGPRVRLIFLAVLVMGLWIVLAIFGLVIAAVLRQYPAAIFPVLFQIPLAVAIGFTVHRRGGSILIPSIVALVLMYASVVVGDASFGPTIGGLHAFNQFLAAQPTWMWVVGLLVYSYIASVIPVWMLLQPRDYINALQLVSALGLLVVGLVAAAFFGGAPDAAAPAVDALGAAGPTAAAAGSARPALEIVAPMFNAHPKGAPPLIPLLFITIACGAISGFHCLVSSGTTSKQLRRETDALAVGYGSMLTEGFLAILVIVACAAGIGLGITKDIKLIGAGTTVSQERYAFGHVSLPRTDGKYCHVSAVERVEGVDWTRNRVLSADERTFSIVSTVDEADSMGGYGIGVGPNGILESSFTSLKGNSVTLSHKDAPGDRRVVVDGQSVEFDPSGWTYRLDGPLAFRKQYESWSAAGALAATVGAFVSGGANLVASLGIPLGFAIALMGVMVASFAGTTMDTACRLQRYVIEELARTFLPRPPGVACAHCGYDLSGLETGIESYWPAQGDGNQESRDAAPQAESTPAPTPPLHRSPICPECGGAIAGSQSDQPTGAHHVHAGLRAQRALASDWNPCKWLATPHGATVIAVVTAAALAAIPAPGKGWTLAESGSGGMLLWPLFGATNQVLGGMAFLVIGAWLIATKRPWWFIVVPTLFMLVMPAWALAWQAFVGDADTPSWIADKKWLLVGIAAATLALEAWLVTEVVARMLRARSRAPAMTSAA